MTPDDLQSLIPGISMSRINEHEIAAPEIDASHPATRSPKWSVRFWDGMAYNIIRTWLDADPNTFQSLRKNLLSQLGTPTGEFVGNTDIIMNWEDDTVKIRYMLFPGNGSVPPDITALFTDRKLESLKLQYEVSQTGLHYGSFESKSFF
jgi:hypothetical protein